MNIIFQLVPSAWLFRQSGVGVLPPLRQGRGRSLSLWQGGAVLLLLVFLLCCAGTAAATDVAGTAAATDVAGTAAATDVAGTAVTEEPSRQSRPDPEQRQPGANQGGLDPVSQTRLPGGPSGSPSDDPGGGLGSGSPSGDPGGGLGSDGLSGNGLRGNLGSNRGVSLGGSNRGGSLGGGVSGSLGEDYRAPEEVFHASLTAVDDQTLVAFFHIEQGYLLYRDEFAFQLTAATPAADDLRIAHAFLPAGAEFDDPKYGLVQVYTGVVEVPLVLNRPAPPGTELTVTLSFRGCVPGGMCYPTITEQLRVSIGTAMRPFTGSGTSAPNETAAPTTGESAGAQIARQTLDKATGPDSGTGPGTDSAPAAAFSREFAVFLLSVFFAGLGMAFSACVYPMIPIVSALVTGENNTRGRALLLTLLYVLALALTYAALGAVVGWLGWNLQAWSQTAIVLIPMALLFVLFAGGLFGLFTLDLPGSVKHWISGWHAPQHSGRIGGALLLGVISALVVGPCTTPVLGAILAYVAGEGGALGGALGLFVMGLGMGAPLILVGLGLQVILPRTGAWMYRVRTLMGCLMLGIAVLFISRLLAPSHTLLLWTGWLLLCALLILLQEQRRSPPNRWVRVAASLLAVLAIVSAIGIGRGATTVRAALIFWQQPEPEIEQLSWRGIGSSDELAQAVAQARAQGQPVLLRITANWCTTCRAIDRLISETPQVQRELTQFERLELDLSEIDEAKDQLMQAYRIYGPPMFLCVPVATVREASLWVGEYATDTLLERLGACRAD